MDKLVIKIGTNILTTPHCELDLNHLRHLVDQLVGMATTANSAIVVVTSGAITAGAARLGIVPETIAQKQSAAAVGQILLMQEYARFFERFGYQTAQILVTKDCFTDPSRANLILDTITQLINRGVVPIINENDTVAVEEIRFGDNDELSANMAVLIKANRLILLTDIDGLYSDHPDHPSAQLIPHLDCVSDQALQMASGPQSPRSRGGMRSKLLAAKTATEFGIPVIIANGRTPDILRSIDSGKFVGTTISPRKSDPL